MNGERMTRRELLVDASKVGMGLLGAAGCGAVRSLTPTIAEDRALISRDNWRRLAPKGEPVIVALPGASEPLILMETDEGAFRALSSRCPHLGCQVRASRRFLRCPCHGSTFRPDGSVVRGPATTGLTAYAVHATEDAIEITLE